MRSRQWRLTFLEPRIAPALIQWDGGPTGNGTDWLDPVNWQDDLIPTASDAVAIVPTGSNPAIEIGGLAPVIFMTSNRSINVNAGGTLALGAGSSILPALNLAGGSVDFQDGSALSFTTIDGIGSLLILANRHVQLSLGTINLPLSVQGHLTIPEDVVVNSGMTVAVGGKLQVVGDSAPTLLSITSDLTNHGLIELTSVDQVQTTRLKISNGTLTNSTDGIVNMLAGTGGPREIQLATSSAHFANSGKWNVQADTSVTRLGSGQTVTTSGDIEINPNRTLTINAPVIFATGSIGGGGNLVLSQWQLNASLATPLASVTLSGLSGPGQWTIPASTVVKTTNNTNLQAPIINHGTLIVRGSSTIAAPFGSQTGSTIRIQGEPGTGSAVLHTTMTWSNYSVIELTSATSINNAALIVDSGSFVNSATGTIKVLNGAGGLRTLNIMFAGSFSNQGQIALVDAGLTTSGQPLANDGSIDIAGGTMLSTTTVVTNVAPGIITGLGTIKSGGLSGSGAIAPGTAVGTFTSVGNVNHGGKLSVDLNGFGQFDQLRVQGLVALSGPLDIHVNYPAKVGDEFLILDNDGSDSITGNFASLTDGDTINIGGTVLEIDYQGGTGNDVLLKVVSVGPPPLSASIKVNDGSLQRSLLTSFHVEFNGPATFPDGLAAAFQLEHLNPGQAPDLVGLSITGNGDLYSITFNDAKFAPAPTKSLIDGNYSLRLIASKIQGQGGPFNEGSDLVVSTHRLFGDSNGDRAITAVDFSAFRLAYGAGPSIFDFDGDNGTNAGDFNQFRLRYGTTV